MERNIIIKQKLTEIGEVYDNLKPFLQEYLDEIENLIQSKEQVQLEALEELKGSSYNVSSISKELGFSRTTFYNYNQLLKRYIEYSAEITEKVNPYKAYDEIKESKQKLQEQVWLMENRDIDFEILKHKRALLASEVKEKVKEIERLQSRVNKLSAELYGYKITIKK